MKKKIFSLYNCFTDALAVTTSTLGWGNVGLKSVQFSLGSLDVTGN